MQRLDRVVPGLQRVALGDGVDVLEAMAGRWVMGGTPDTWERTTSVPACGATTTWLTDSPTGPYPDSSDNWARTTAQLRTRLLTSVDVTTSLQGKVATGGRISAHKAVR